MSFTKKIKNKVLENYNSHRGYFFVKLFIIVLLFIIIIWSFLGIFTLISNKVEFGELLGVLKKSLTFMLIRFILNGVVELIFFPSGKIEDNMKILPSGVSGKKILVQYGLQKEITPSEAAILMYRRAESSNLICIIYSWINSKIVKLYNEGEIKYIKVLHRLGEDAPTYEKYLFNKLFHGNEESDVVFDRDLLSEYRDRVNDMIVFYCEKKGYIKKIEDTMGYNSKAIGCGSSILTLLIWFFCILGFASGNILWGIFLFIFYLIIEVIRKGFIDKSSKLKKRESNVAVSFMLFILWVLCLTFFIIGEILLGISILIIIFLIGSYKDKNESYDIVLTDKGKKMLSEIYGYKYYLEHCEEEQINSDLEENEFYSKHLPYAIALKLNWKIIDELS